MRCKLVQNKVQGLRYVSISLTMNFSLYKKIDISFPNKLWIDQKIREWGDRKIRTKLHMHGLSNKKLWEVVPTYK